MLVLRSRRNALPGFHCAASGRAGLLAGVNRRLHRRRAGQIRHAGRRVRHLPHLDARRGQPAALIFYRHHRARQCEKSAASTTPESGASRLITPPPEITAKQRMVKMSSYRALSATGLIAHAEPAPA